MWLLWMNVAARLPARSNSWSRKVSRQMANPMLQLINSRRVIRSFSQQPVSKQDLEAILETARWAPSASNRRLQKFIVVQNRRKIGQIRAISPGMSGYPTALVVICTDWQKAGQEGLRIGECGVQIDVGTAAENMLLAAHALGLGAGPVTSFSKEAAKVLLNLPEWLSPDLMICLGHPAGEAKERRVKPARPLRWQELTYWERFEAN